MGVPASGHMPFRDHRTVAQVWATERRSIAAAIRVLVDDRPVVASVAGQRGTEPRSPAAISFPHEG